jgi:hypothetical protein
MVALHSHACAILFLMSDSVTEVEIRFLHASDAVEFIRMHLAVSPAGSNEQIGVVGKLRGIIH